MIDGKELDDLFRCLLAGVRTPADDVKHRYEQSRQLLLAFDKISDSELRQELIVLIEIVSKMPEALRKNCASKLGVPALQQFH
jgi:hypothetical protein